MNKETIDYILGKIKPDDLKDAFTKKAIAKKLLPIIPYYPKRQIVWEITDKKLNEFLDEIKKDKEDGTNLL